MCVLFKSQILLYASFCIHLSSSISSLLYIPCLLVSSPLLPVPTSRFFPLTFSLNLSSSPSCTLLPICHCLPLPFSSSCAITVSVIHVVTVYSYSQTHPTLRHTSQQSNTLFTVLLSVLVITSTACSPKLLEVSRGLFSRRFQRLELVSPLLHTIILDGMETEGEGLEGVCQCLFTLSSRVMYHLVTHIPAYNYNQGHSLKNGI